MHLRSWQRERERSTHIFLKLPFLPLIRQAVHLIPVLRQWLSTADERYCFLAMNGSLQPVVYNKFVVGTALASSMGTKKRQKRATFSEAALQRLNREFGENPLPNVFRMEELSKETGIEYKRVKVWFCNKRQTMVKNVAVGKIGI